MASAFPAPRRAGMEGQPVPRPRGLSPKPDRRRGIGQRQEQHRRCGREARHLGPATSCRGAGSGHGLHRGAKGAGAVPRWIGEAGRAHQSSPLTMVSNSTRVASALPARSARRATLRFCQRREHLRGGSPPASAPCISASTSAARVACATLRPCTKAWPSVPSASRSVQRVAVTSPRLNGAPVPPVRPRDHDGSGLRRAQPVVGRQIPPGEPGREGLGCASGQKAHPVRAGHDSRQLDKFWPDN